MDPWLVLMLLLFGSALFSASELAIMGVPLYRVKRYVRSHSDSKAARIIEFLRDNPERTLITILIGNNLINVILSLYAGQVGDGIIANIALTWAVWFLVISASITFLILFFGEIIPKVFATRFAMQFALWTAPVMWGLSYLLRPVVILLEWVVTSINKLFRQEVTWVTKDDVEIFVEEGEKQWLFTDIESMIVRNLMDFRETSVDAVFRHRTEIFALDQSLTLREAIEETLAHPHSRIPIYANDKDTIIGLLTMRDLLTISYDEDNMNRPLHHFPIKEIAKVPVTASIFEMFIQMKKHGRHLAIVVDEYGGTAWLVTFEDILEAMVWDIRDEVDTNEEQDMVIIDEDTLLVKGDVILRELLHHFKIGEFTIPEGYETEIDEETMLSYIILHEFKNFAKKSDSIVFGPFTLIVTKADPQKIHRVRVEYQKKDTEEK